MFVTLTQLQKGEPTLLQTVIDNTGGKLYVALRGFHYEDGYRNIRSSQGFFTRIPHPQNPKTFINQTYPVPTGLYDFERLSLFIKENINGVRIMLTAVGIINLFIPPPIEIKFQSDLRQILGIAEKGWISGAYVGDRPGKITVVYKRLYIYLDQLSTTSNLIDGKPSTLLTIVPAAVNGETADITPTHPMHKKLEVGILHQLDLRVLDVDCTMVQNHEKSMTAVLEIRENVVCNFN